MLSKPDNCNTGAGPTRILYLDHTASLGGGELSLFRLVTNLDIARFTPIVVLSTDGDLRIKLASAGVETHVLPLSPYIISTRKDSLGIWSLVRVRTFIRIAAYAKLLATFVREHSIEIVHTNSLKSAVFGGLAARLAKVPVIWHIRDRISDDYLPGPVARLFRMLCRYIPNYVIANSCETLRTLKLPKSIRASVVYSGVRSAEVIERRVACSSDPDVPAQEAPARCPPVIGVVGRLSRWKGQHVFIRAAEVVCRAVPIATFLIVGSAMFDDTAYEAEIRRLAVQCGLEGRIAFLGFRSDVAALIATMDVLVHASIIPEPFGQVIIEAMAAGTPVVASRGGGVIEILEEGVTGHMVEMDSVEAIADAIVKILNDPETAATMARAAQSVVLDRFTIERSVIDVQSIYAYLSDRTGKRNPDII